MTRFRRELLLALFFAAMIFGHFYEVNRRQTLTWTQLAIEAAAYAGSIATAGGVKGP